MRVAAFVLVGIAVSLSASAPASAQEWTEYMSTQDRFAIVFPGQPKIEDITWPSEYGAVFPGRVHSVQQGPNRFSVTVIDYTGAEQAHAKLKKEESFQDSVYWQIDIQASIQYAASKFRYQPGVKVTYDAWHYIDLVEGHQLQLLYPDESRSYIAIYLHENRLYILDARVPKGAPAQGLFQQNLSFVDEKGARVRYDEIYSNRLPPRPRRQRGGNLGAGTANTRGGAAGQ
jgi:hypothetical protein